MREENPFLLWCEDIDCTVEYNPKTSDISSITDLHARWTVIIVTFNTNGGGGSIPASMRVLYNNSTYGDLPEPSRTGYTFTGWFNEKNESVTSSTPVSFPYDHTLYAHWSINKYTITFEVDGGSECESITQDYNTDVELPEPTKTGYTFDCWCSDPELSSEYTETTMPAKDVTITAQWNINSYILTFVFNNGDENEVRTLDFNEEIDYPDNVVKTGYTFNEWDNKPDRMPAESITITAQWIASMVTIAFDRKTLGDTSALEEVVRELIGTENVIIEFITDEEEEEGSTIICIIKFSDKISAEEISGLWRASRTRRS